MTANVYLGIPSNFPNIELFDDNKEILSNNIIEYTNDIRWVLSRMI